MGGGSKVCAVCGMGGYWVAYSPRHGEDRCVNHLDDDVQGDAKLLENWHRVGECPPYCTMEQSHG